MVTSWNLKQQYVLKIKISLSVHRAADRKNSRTLRNTPKIATIFKQHTRSQRCIDLFFCSNTLINGEVELCSSSVSSLCFLDDLPVHQMFHAYFELTKRSMVCVLCLFWVQNLGNRVSKKEKRFKSMEIAAQVLLSSQKVSIYWLKISFNWHLIWLHRHNINICSRELCIYVTQVNKMCTCAALKYIYVIYIFYDFSLNNELVTDLAIYVILTYFLF